MKEQRHTKWLIRNNEVSMKVTTEKPMTVMECAKLFNPAFVQPIVEHLFDRDIYYVEKTSDGKKELNVQRTYYDDEYINVVEYTGLRLPIPTTREEFDTAVLNSKQYSGPVSFDRQTALRIVENDIQLATPLPIEEVDETTPCGMYIDYNPNVIQ